MTCLTKLLHATGHRMFSLSLSNVVHDHRIK
jgi:hypothetical protein